MMNVWKTPINELPWYHKLWARPLNELLSLLEIFIVKYQELFITALITFILNIIGVFLYQKITFGVSVLIFMIVRILIEVMSDKDR